MTKCLVYMVPIALIGLMATPAPAGAATWSGSMARDIAAATADRTDAPLVLVQRGGRGGGGGGARGGGGGARGGSGGARGGGGGGGSWAGVSGGRGNGNRANVSGGNRGNFSGNTVNRNTVVTGGGYNSGGAGWGGVAAGVAVGAVVGAAASNSSAPACPYPDYPNCGL
jgi:hypothetical protein